MTYVSSYYHCFAGKIKVNLALHSWLTYWKQQRKYFLIFSLSPQNKNKKREKWKCLSAVDKAKFSVWGIFCQMIPLKSMGYIVLCCASVLLFKSVPSERLCMTCTVFFLSLFNSL
jgi:hypothetical protein